MYWRATYIGINSVWCHTVKYATRLFCVGLSALLLRDVVRVSEPRGRCCPTVLSGGVCSVEENSSTYPILWVGGVMIIQRLFNSNPTPSQPRYLKYYPYSKSCQRDPYTTARQSSGVLDGMTSYAIYSYISSSCIHAVCIPLPDEARLGQNCGHTVIKFEQLHLWWHVALLKTTTL